MSEANVFRDWLKSTSLLVTGDTDGQYATWLAEAGALVVHAADVERVREVLSDQTRAFHGAVLDGDHDSAPWDQVMQDLPASCAAIVLSEQVDGPMLHRLRDSGAQFLTKSASQADFLYSVSSAVSLAVPNMQQLAARAASMWKLPRQQARLLYYNLWSYTDQEIADAMGLSRHTVQQYQEELRKRTGVRTKHAYLRRLMACAGAQPPLNMSDDTLLRLTEDRRNLMNA